MLRTDAGLWARWTEREIDLGQTLMPRKIEDVKTFGDLDHLHLSNRKKVGKAKRRSRAFNLDLPQDRPGTIRLPDRDREGLIAFGWQRADAGARTVMLSVDPGFHSNRACPWRSRSWSSVLTRNGSWQYIPARFVNDPASKFHSANIALRATAAHTSGGAGSGATLAIMRCKAGRAPMRCR